MINPKKKLSNKSFKFFLIPFLLTFILIGCEKDPDNFGSEFIESTDSINLEVDSSYNLKSVLIKNDSLETSSRTYGIIGNSSDPYYGNMRAGFLSQIGFSVGYGFGADAVADSVFLYLRVNKHYDINRRANLNVYQLSRALDQDKDYYSNENPEDYHYPLQLAQETEYLSKDSLKISLDPTFGDFLLQYDTNNVDSSEMYYERVKGIYCTVGEIKTRGYFAQVMLNNTFSRITVWYHDAGTPEGESESMDFRLNGDLKRFSTYQYDYSELEQGGENVVTYLENDNSQISDSLLFINSLAGSYAKFTLPEKLRENFQNNDDRLLASAEIILPISNDHNAFVPTSELELYYNTPDSLKISAGNLTYLPNKNQYMGDLTQFIHNHIEGTLDETFYLHVSNNVFNPGRSTIYGANHSQPIKFVIKYYKP